MKTKITYPLPKSFVKYIQMSNSNPRDRSLKIEKACYWHVAIMGASYGRLESIWENGVNGLSIDSFKRRYDEFFSKIYFVGLGASQGACFLFTCHSIIVRTRQLIWCIYYICNICAGQGSRSNRRKRRSKNK